jgi:hypothetical protein
MDFMSGFVLHMLIGLSLMGPVTCEQMTPSPKANKMPAVTACESVAMPDWVTHIPEECFVGISRPCQAIEEARQDALNSAVTQILQAMGAEYSLYYTSSLTGNKKYSHHELNESLTYTAKWFLRSNQQNIRKSYVQQIPDGYLCFVLIDFPAAKLERLRQLTIGPRVGARLVKAAKEGMLIEVRENNSVGVTLTDYQIEVTTQNRHAGLITLFAWKVPKCSHRNFKGLLNRKISIRGTSETFFIPTSSADTGFRKILLGSTSRVAIILRGYDEIGRELSFPVHDL